MEESHLVLAISVFSSFLSAGFGVLWLRDNAALRSREPRHGAHGGPVDWELCCLFNSLSITHQFRYPQGSRAFLGEELGVVAAVGSRVGTSIHRKALS